MADTNRAFLQRVVSGLLGAALVFAISYFGGTQGIQFVICVAVVLAIREFSRMAFLHWQMPAALVRTYWVICALLFTVLFVHFSHSLVVFATANVIFLSAGLWLGHGKTSNENLLAALAMGCFGMLYCVLFPFFAVRMAMLDLGGYWFFFLLCVVFFGDTFAYFAGRWFGRRKLMMEVSPNKTWEGAVGGLVGSCFAGMTIVASTFPSVSLWQTFVFCVLCGVAAQSGDLIVSLVKRVAHVKDSGHIMPGHGGILDRLDGIFIACPLVYAFAIYVKPI